MNEYLIMSIKTKLANKIFNGTKTFGTNLSTLTLEEFKNILAGNSEIPLLEERFHIIKMLIKL